MQEDDRYSYEIGDLGSVNIMAEIGFNEGEGEEASGGGINSLTSSIDSRKNSMSSKSYCKIRLGMIVIA